MTYYFEKLLQCHLIAQFHDVAANFIILLSLNSVRNFLSFLRRHVSKLRHLLNISRKFLDFSFLLIKKNKQLLAIGVDDNEENGRSWLMMLKHEILQVCCCFKVTMPQILAAIFSLEKVLLENECFAAVNSARLTDEFL